MLLFVRVLRSGWKELVQMGPCLSERIVSIVHSGANFQGEGLFSKVNSTSCQQRQLFCPAAAL